MFQVGSVVPSKQNFPSIFTGNCQIKESKLKCDTRKLTRSLFCWTKEKITSKKWKKRKTHITHWKQHWYRKKEEGRKITRDQVQFSFVLNTVILQRRSIVSIPNVFFFFSSIRWIHCIVFCCSANRFYRILSFSNKITNEMYMICLGIFQCFFLSVFLRFSSEFFFL